MVRAFYLLTILMFMSLPVPAQADIVTLEELLSRLDEAPASRALQAEASQASAKARISRSRQGWSVFGGADIGRFRELDTTAGAVDYTGTGLQLGLRHPLLGALRERIKATQALQAEADQAKVAAVIAQAEHRLALRQTYADWWLAQRHQDLCESQKASADHETDKINQRYNKGQLRGSDHLWLTRSWQQITRNCQAAATRLTETLNRLQRLAQHTIPHESIAMAPDAGIQMPPSEHWHSTLENHPLLEQRRQEWQIARKSEDKWYDTLDASISLSHRLDQREDIPGTGSGWVAGISFEVPLAGIGQPPRTASLQKDAARYRWLDTRNRLQTELSQSLRNYQNRFRELRYASEQQELAELRLWEQKQREQLANEGSFIATRTLVLDLARARRAQIEARHAAWQSLTELQLIQDLTDIPAGVAKAWPENAHWSKTIYVWQSHDLLSPDTRAATLQAIKEAGFNTIYLGLTAQQLEHPQVEKILKETISQAKARGISTDLLLGEPLWMEDAHRDDLTEILKRLSSVPFRHVHLDLEVEQLGWPVQEGTLEGWLATLRAVTDISPWPVSIVTHHRWFTSPDFQNPVCIPCEMPKLGIQNVSLMIYTTNQKSLGRLAATAAGQWPELDFHIVQSVESQLPPKNSWYGMSRQALDRSARKWREQWENLGIKGLAWQAWKDYPARVPGHREQP